MILVLSDYLLPSTIMATAPRSTMVAGDVLDVLILAIVKIGMALYLENTKTFSTLYRQVTPEVERKQSRILQIVKIPSQWDAVKALTKIWTAKTTWVWST